MKKLLFLGYNNKQTPLINFIKESYKKKYEVYDSNNPLKINQIKDFNKIICFGYKNIIDKNMIERFKGKIINLHIGYLPYNRGAHPNFWSFVENTPSGISIHEIDENVDTGKIIIQKKIDFDIYGFKKKYTFRNTYLTLIKEIEFLFKHHFVDIVENEFDSYDQIGRGTHHFKSQLPVYLKNWDQKIYPFIRKYDKLNKIQTSQKLEIIDEIENTRKNNNVNWMNIVRLSLINSPEQTKNILKKINFDDNKISDLFKKLTK